jgi:hypothetical protein
VSTALPEAGRWGGPADGADAWWVDSRRARALRGKLERAGWATWMGLEYVGRGLCQYGVHCARGASSAAECWIVECGGGAGGGGGGGAGEGSGASGVVVLAQVEQAWARLCRQVLG